MKLGQGKDVVAGLGEEEADGAETDGASNVVSLPIAKCRPGSLALWRGQWGRVEAARGMQRTLCFETRTPMPEEDLRKDLPPDVLPEEVLTGEIIYELRVDVDVRELTEPGPKLVHGLASGVDDALVLPFGHGTRDEEEAPVDGERP